VLGGYTGHSGLKCKGGIYPPIFGNSRSRVGESYGSHRSIAQCAPAIIVTKSCSGPISFREGREKT
jgi:hypothetical protein